MGFDLFQKYWLNNAGIHSTVALMYHSISAKGSSLGWRGVVSLPRFRTQLDLLNTEGRQTVCICDLTLNNRLPESNIVITFYDGYVDNLTFCKELAKRGMHATCFIVSGSIGREPAWHTDEYPDVRLFNAAKLHNMQSTNMKVGSHATNHVHLTEANDIRLHADLTHSKTTLKYVLGIEISSFAYPCGAWNGRYAKTVREVDYRSASAPRTDWALFDGNPHQLHRLTVFNTVTNNSLVRKLHFGNNVFPGMPSHATPCNVKLPA